MMKKKLRIDEVLSEAISSRVTPLESYTDGEVFADLFCEIEGKGYQLRISRAPQYDARTKKRFSVAVRPTPEEVKRLDLCYDEEYYEAREGIYECESEDIAKELYCVEYGYFLHSDEREHIRATDIGTARNYRAWKMNR
jgi:hypothetical protein